MIAMLIDRYRAVIDDDPLLSSQSSAAPSAAMTANARRTSTMATDFTSMSVR
jgi:hypothetical protein